jgi:F-type H+-transporting ATPase subunit a
MRIIGLFKPNLNKFILILAILSFSSAILFANEPAKKADSEHADAIVEVQDSTAVVAENAEATHENAEEEKFNPSELILEHITDSHDWHLWGHTSLPLPIIIYTPKGLEVFSSSHFHHGEQAYTTANYTYKIEENKIVVLNAENEIDEAATKTIIDISITKNVCSLLISVSLLLFIFLSVAKAYKKTVGKAPKGFQSMIEPIILFVRDDVAKPNLGKKYAKFMPFLLTIFFFIWINNMMGLIPFFPGGANVSGNIAFTMVLALVTFIVITVNGGKVYWSHIFAPHVPWWLYPLLVPVEIFGMFTKPIALMIRLFANITAGHIIVLALISIIFVNKNVAWAGLSVPMALFISILEVLVAFLQGFLFAMLSALFIGAAVEEAHH